MSSARYDLDVMQKQLEKNASDLHKLAKASCPVDQRDESKNSHMINRLLDTVDNLHELVRSARDESTVKSMTEQEGKERIALYLAIISKYAKNNDNTINELVASFPEDKRAEVLLITGSMKRNLDATRAELSLIVEGFQESYFANNRPVASSSSKHDN